MLGVGAAGPMVQRLRSHPTVALSAIGALGIDVRALAGGGLADKAPKLQGGTAVDLYARVRGRTVLHRAWVTVRASGLMSDSERTRHETLQFDVNIPARGSITYRGALTPASAPARARSPVETRRNVAPAAPTMFYIIPGCYAGNVPPKDAGLPPTCDQRQVITFRP